MSSVMYDISRSLDGYVRAANPRPEEPLGEGGEALHRWAMNDAAAGDRRERNVAAIGVMICGRVTYDDSIRWWQARAAAGDKTVAIMGGPTVATQFLAGRAAPALPHQARGATTPPRTRRQQHALHGPGPR